jgi:hypothetical protein
LGEGWADASDESVAIAEINAAAAADLVEFAGAKLARCLKSNSQAPGLEDVERQMCDVAAADVLQFMGAKFSIISVITFLSPHRVRKNSYRGAIAAQISRRKLL